MCAGARSAARSRQIRASSGWPLWAWTPARLARISGSSGLSVAAAPIRRQRRRAVAARQRDAAERVQRPGVLGLARQRLAQQQLGLVELRWPARRIARGPAPMGPAPVDDARSSDRHPLGVEADVVLGMNGDDGRRSQAESSDCVTRVPRRSLSTPEMVVLRFVGLDVELARDGRLTADGDAQLFADDGGELHDLGQHVGDDMHAPRRDRDLGRGEIEPRRRLEPDATAPEAVSAPAGSGKDRVASPRAPARFSTARTWQAPGCAKTSTSSPGIGSTRQDTALAEASLSRRPRRPGLSAAPGTSRQDASSAPPARPRRLTVACQVMGPTRVSRQSACVVMTGHADQAAIHTPSHRL